MTDQVLNILKFVLLGLLYLFFARVLWAVWSEVRAPNQRAARPSVTANPRPVPTPAPTPAGGLPAPQQSRRAAKKEQRGRADRLVVIEPKQRQGVTVPLAGEITVGRDPNCTISIADDGYVSQLHLRFYDYEGQPMVEDLDSTNGTFHNGNRLHGSRLVHPGDRIQVGTTVIEAQ
jgi:pSer/pThr/pTyr-binding forkhead associated (FHA) protein